MAVQTECWRQERRVVTATNLYSIGEPTPSLYRGKIEPLDVMAGRLKTADTTTRPARKNLRFLCPRLPAILGFILSVYRDRPPRFLIRRQSNGSTSRGTDREFATSTKPPWWIIWPYLNNRASNAKACCASMVFTKDS